MFGFPTQWSPLKFVYISVLTLSPADVPTPLAGAINSGSFKGAPSPNDVISFLKKHICDKELSQSPVLVLTSARAARMDIVPTGKCLANNCHEVAIMYTKTL